MTGVKVPMMPPLLLTAAFWSSWSMSTWRYSTGLERPRGSKPRSPGREPSNHPGRVVLGIQRPGSPEAVDFLGGGRKKGGDGVR